MTPPVQVLLPHQVPFNDSFKGPIRITSSDPISLLLLSRQNSSRNPKPSILLTCSNVSVEGEWTRYGRFVRAASMVEVIRFETLFELRALLRFLAFETQSSEVADSEEEDEANAVLCIHGFEGVHRDAGVLSAQSLSATLASAVDTARVMGCELVISDEVQEEEVQVLDAASQLPSGLLELTVPVERVYERLCRAAWTMKGDCTGEWKEYSTGLTYHVTWQESIDGFVKSSQSTVK